MTKQDTTEIRKEACNFDRTVTRRNRIEVAAAGIMAPVFVALAVRADDLGLQLGFALLAAGVVGVGALMLLIGKASGIGIARGHAGGAGRYEEELSHQMRLMRWVPAWYLGPLVPGIVGVFVASVAGSSEGLTVVGAALGIGVPAVVFAGVGIANRIGAARLQRQLGALPARG